MYIVYYYLDDMMVVTMVTAFLPGVSRSLTVSTKVFHVKEKKPKQLLIINVSVVGQ